MSSDPEQAVYADEDLFSGREHLRPAWQVVALTIAMVAASALVLALAG